MKAIVFGGSGLIGSALVSDFERRGWETFATSTTGSGGRMIPFRLERDRFSATPQLPTECDVAVICAGLADIDTCKRDQGYSRSVNVTGTACLVKELCERGVRPVFCSTDYVYSGEKGDYTEEDPTDPITVYGAQKVQIEELVQRECPDGLVVRLSKVFTADPGDRTLLSDWHRTIRSGRTIVCASDQVFCPTFLPDVVAGLVSLAEKRVSGLCHLCQPVKYSRASLLEEFAAHLGIQDYEVDIRPTEELGFLDRRGRDVSLVSRRFVAETGYSFTPMAECFEALREALPSG